MKCPKCSAELPEGLQFCPNCGSPVAPAQPAAPKVKKPKAPRKPMPKGSLKDKANYLVESLPVDKKLKKPIALGACVLAAFLVLLLVAGIFRLIFGSGLILDELSDAAHKTIEKGNFTMELKLGGDSYELAVDMNVKKGEIMAYGELDGDTFAIYDGYAITDSYYLNARDIDDELEAFFDSYNDMGDLDDVDLEEMLDEAGMLDMVEDMVDVGELQDGYEEFLDLLNDKSWLKKNAGYKVEKDDGVAIHCFEIDAYTLADTMLDIFSGAFEDREMYLEARDAVRSQQKALKKMKFSAEIGVEDGYLVSAEIEYMGESISLEITDIGETDIDEKDLKDLLKEAKD